jgi:formylmethanofuran dehydrogenase subunit C
MLGTLSPEAIHAQLGDAFDIEGQPGDTLTLRGLAPLPGLGAGMTRGRLVIQGDAGDDLGAAMTGGEIHVRGNAGDRAGGPSPQGRVGMNRGVIVIHGNAGDDAGLRMRRGLLAVAGNVGRSPGYRMIAGTIVAGRGPLDYPGLEMQRGTIISLDPQASIQTGPSFAADNIFEASSMAVLGLMLRQLRTLGMDITDAMERGRWRLSSGDRFELGKGELWQWIH